MKILKKIIIVALLAILASSCTLSKIARLGDDVQVGEITNIEIKGLTGVVISLQIDNDSSLDITMSEASIDLKIGGKGVATLSQVGEATSKRHSAEAVKTVWRLKEISPITLMLLSSRISNNDLKDLSINYTAEFSAGKISRTLSGKDIDISKFAKNLAF